MQIEKKYSIHQMFFFIKCAQIASSDGGSEGRDSDIWTEYGGEVEIFQPFVKILNLIFF